MVQLPKLMENALCLSQSAFSDLSLYVISQNKDST